MSTDPRIAALEAEGYVVLKAKSYRAAQERGRVDRALREAAEREVDRTEDWAREAFAEQRRLADRCTFLYGVAIAHGATLDELKGDS